MTRVLSVTLIHSKDERDQALMKNLLAYLRPLEEGGKLRIELCAVDAAALPRTDVCLALASPAFVQESQKSVVVSEAMERRQAKKMRLIPILLRPTPTLRYSPVGNYQPLPSNGSAVSEWPDQDRAWVNVLRALLPLIDPSGTIPVPEPASR